MTSGSFEDQTARTCFKKVIIRSWAESNVSSDPPEISQLAIGVYIEIKIGKGTRLIQFAVLCIGSNRPAIENPFRPELIVMRIEHHVQFCLPF